MRRGRGRGYELLMSNWSALWDALVQDRARLPQPHFVAFV